MGERKFRVNFLLPFQSPVPTGGNKLVFQYANQLVERGHEVCVVLPKGPDARTGPVGELKNFLWTRINQLRHPVAVTWFKLDPRIKVLRCSDLREKWLPEADFSVATFWRTAPIVS